MASTKTRAALLVVFALYAYLISETDAHLRIGKEFIPVRQELKELIRDRINPAFRDTKKGLNQRQKWKPRIDEIPELYREEPAQDKVINILLSFLWQSPDFLPSLLTERGHGHE